MKTGDTETDLLAELDGLTKRCAAHARGRVCGGSPGGWPRAALRVGEAGRGTFPGALPHRPHGTALLTVAGSPCSITDFETDLTETVNKAMNRKVV